jgi:hypothetical protein
MLAEKFILFLETLISHASDGKPQIVISRSPHVAIKAPYIAVKAPPGKQASREAAN